MPLIRSNHIVEFGDQAAGKDRIGELMRRLIWAWSARRVVGLSFHANDSNNFPGWDGWAQLNLESGNFCSVWELSTNASSPPRKIRDDFVESLSKALPNGWEHQATTYVIVTSRKLKKPSGIREELLRRADNPWRDIQVIDANTLEQWIEKCPAVEEWMGEEFAVGLGKFGETIRRRWKNWSGSTSPLISTALVLAGRKTEEIISALDFAGNKISTIQADSPDEAVAILFAAIESLPLDQRNVVFANALIVQTKEAAESYAELPTLADSPPLTILMPSAAPYANQLARAGHKVILALGRVDSNYHGGVVKRALRSEFEAALVSSMGLSAHDANSDARACGSSVSIWRVWNIHRTASSGEETPIWARSPDSRRVVAAVLARGWDSKLEGDMNIVSELAKVPFATYVNSIQEFLVCNDPLHELAGSVTKVVAPSVAYALICRSITSADIDKFEEVATSVFGTVEPKVSDVWNTESEESLAYKAEIYSEWLRDGLAETLLAMAFLPTPPTGIFDKHGGGQGFANHLVESIPGLKSDPRVLASLRDQLPLLAEATPLPFVDALESLLQGETPLDPLFTDRGLFGSRFHVGIVWALEVLCWSTEYLSRAALLLATMNERFGDKELGNSPLTSLKEIFLAWNPGTSASISERTEVLALLVNAHPRTGWSLLLKLLPSASGDSAGNTQVPSWRDFGRSEIRALTRGDLARAYRSYTELALTSSEGELLRQLDLLRFYAEFPEEYREKLLNNLAAEAKGNSPHQTKAWNTLRDFIAKNRSFSSAAWAVKEIDLKRLEVIQFSLKPESPLDRNSWLFDDSWPQLATDSNAFEQRDHILKELRKESLNEIVRELGVDGAIQFSRAVANPHLVGQFLSSVLPNDQIYAAMNTWACSEHPKDLEALKMASASLSEEKGDAWPGTLIKLIKKNSWPTRAQAWSLLAIPAKTELFRLAHSLGPEVEDDYWKNCWISSSDLSKVDLPEVVSKLIQHDRASYLLTLTCLRLPDFGSALVKQVIEAAIKQTLEGTTNEVGQMFAYYISKALSWLRKQPDVDRMSLLPLEYPLVSVLTSGGADGNETLVLHETLANDPGFFVEILCDAYGPATAKSEETIDERTRVRATAAWRLLHSWKVIPGLRQDQSVDEFVLKEWTNQVRMLAIERDRADIADQKIGEILFHAPGDAASSDWPPTAVINMIEKVASKHIEQGFELECFNSRGVTSRAPLSGGSLERDLEQFWLLKASKVSSKTPRTRAMFKRIAEDWGNQGKWQDNQSAQMRMRWS